MSVSPGGRRYIGPPVVRMDGTGTSPVGNDSGFRGTVGNTGPQSTAPVNGLLVDTAYAGHKAIGISPTLPQHNPPDVGIEPPWILYGPDPRKWPQSEIQRIRHTPWELERVRQWWLHRNRHGSHPHQPIHKPSFHSGH